MNPEDQVTPVDPATNTGEGEGNNEPSSTPQAPSQPVTQEKKFTKRERLEFSLEKIQKQLEELDVS